MVDAKLLMELFKVVNLLTLRGPNRPLPNYTVALFGVKCWLVFLVLLKWKKFNSISYGSSSLYVNGSLTQITNPQEIAIQQFDETFNLLVYCCTNKTSINKQISLESTSRIGVLLMELKASKRCCCWYHNLLFIFQVLSHLFLPELQREPYLFHKRKRIHFLK